MKLYNPYLIIFLLLTIAMGCSKEKFDDLSFISRATAPENINAIFDITQNNSGLVTIAPMGNGVATYDVYFGDNTAKPETIAFGKTIQHTYAEGNYTIKIIARGNTGLVTEKTIPLTVSFKQPENLEVNAEIDASNKFKVNVSAKADYETLFRVYFGDGGVNEVPVSFLEGETVSHIYAAIGTYTIRVVALSGGVATSETTKEITIVNPIILPVDFEDSKILYEFGNFDGGIITVIDNPHKNGINTSDKVGQMVKNAGQTWGGSIIRLGNPIDFSKNKLFKMKVFSPRVGAKVLLKVENPTDGGINYEKEVTTTLANSWEELSFDYSAINVSNVYQNIILIFDNGTMGDGSANFTFLFDDITLISSSEGMDLPVTFDKTGVDYNVTDFGNAQTIDAVDPTNASNKVKKTTKPNGAETWAGTTMGTNGKGFVNKVPFTLSTTQMYVRVYSPEPGLKVKLKIENSSNNSIAVETDAFTTVANKWEILLFDFSKHSSGTSALNVANVYDKASIFFDFGNAGSGKFFYWDDVNFLNYNINPNAIVLYGFESNDITYSFTNFDGGVASVVTNPHIEGINTSAKVGKMIKNAGQTWGGCWIGFDSPINFITKNTVKMKVYSPRVGAKVLFKVENQSNSSISYQKEVSTTVANAWEELTFDFSGIDKTNSYQHIVLIFDNGTMGDGSANFTFYFDDICLY